jgi:hypothetical protein
MRWPLFPVPDIPPFSWLKKRGLDHEVKNMKPTLYKLAKLANAVVIGELQVIYDWCEQTSPCAERRRLMVSV